MSTGRSSDIYGVFLPGSQHFPGRLLRGEALIQLQVACQNSCLCRRRKAGVCVGLALGLRPLPRENVGTHMFCIVQQARWLFRMFVTV